MYGRKKLEKYFTRDESMYLFGGGLLAAALISIWLAGGYQVYFLYLVGSLAAPAGLALFIIGSIGRIGQEDIDKAVSDRIWNFDKPLIEDARLAKRLSPRIKPAYIAQFDYEGNDLKSKRGKDGWRTSQYTVVEIFFLTDGIKFIRRTVSVLVDDVDGGSGTEIAEYHFADLVGAEIIRDTVKLCSMKHLYTANRARLKLSAKDGSVALLVQINDDIDSDTLADNINKLINTEIKN